MKKIFAVLALSIALSFIAPAQQFSVAPSVPLDCLVFHKDTTIATDSTFASFYVPFTMNVVAMQVVATKIDTGSSGTGAGTLTLYKYGTSTAIVSDSVTAAYSVMHEAPSTAALGKLTKGAIYKIKNVIALSKKVYGLTVILWYTR